MTDTAELRFKVATGERPLTVNAERKMHHHPRAEVLAAWKSAAGWAATQAGAVRHRFDAARFVFRPYYPNAASLPDTGAIFPVEKAIVDALVELEMVPEDNRWHNAGQLSLPPRVLGTADAPFVSVWVVAHDVDPAHRLPCSCRASWLRSQLGNKR